MNVDDTITELIKRYISSGLNKAIDHGGFYQYTITHHSTVIEDYTLTEQETQVLLQDGLTPKGKPPAHTLPILLLTLLVLSIGCQQSSKSDDDSTKKTSSTQLYYEKKRSTDSIKVVDLLKTVYKWHEKNTAILDFDVEIEDSLQVRINMKSLESAISVLRDAGFFSESFIQNYKKLGELINTRLTSAVPKLQNEINFSFQESDSWTFFQDDAPNFWESLNFSYFNLNETTCTLKWGGNNYEVRFVKESSIWKLSYIEGLDIDKYYK